MAMHSDLQREGYGTIVLGEIVRVFAEVGSAIGMPAMILTPINEDAKRFYKRLGFEPYDRGQRMFLGLEAALATIAAAQAEVDEEE
jgi:GNAT superfamily N-acetyltransferase